MKEVDAGARRMEFDALKDDYPIAHSFMADYMRVNYKWFFGEDAILLGREIRRIANE